MNYPLGVPLGTTVAVTIHPKQADGDPSEIDGAPIVSIESGEAVELLEVMPEGFMIHAIAEGEAVVLIKADVRIGAGIVMLEERIQVTVGEEAATFGLEFGEPV